MQGRPSRADSLLAIYSEISSEIARLRDNEFRTALLSIALDAGLIAVFTNDQVVKNAGNVERYLAISASSLVVLVLIFYLFVLHHYLTQHRTIRRKIEQILEVHEPDIYTSGSLFPSVWNDPEVKFRFQMFGIVTPLVLLMVVFQAGTVLLIWRVTG